MKKKLLISGRIILLGIMLGGCGKRSDTGKEVEIEKLPANMELNKSTIQLNGVNLYQSFRDNEWNIYGTISINIRGLNETEKHWIDKDKTETTYNGTVINPDLYLSCGDNSMDFETLVNYGFSDIGGNRIYFFGTSEGNKYEFSEAELSSSVRIKQDDTYKVSPDKAALHKENHYSYRIKYSSENKIPDITEMPKNILEAFNENLQNIYNNL
jgi:hypothetical protein